ncbi:helix-turn-helix transcriptional regulator [Burkholderia gladioli pv. alliicola]|uniref:helix-turn-helix domain-containing protein n=1 Tax=Burkholderia gladioli TaxID=28095 RepID=UPI002AB81DC6|nr:helix-turn-helix transcriptional regulator [Burkholderia gladioli]MDZ4036171.1 helix-turn-helix transcriptional regulator [Burkholderia gladioli pv. alliicola]
MNTIGSRLREERLRLGLSQDEFAAVGGVLRRAQANYESNERSSDTKYLSAIAGLGVDLLYIILGVRSVSAEPQSASEPATTLEDDEHLLIDGYRQLNEAGKAALQAFMASLGTKDQLTSAPKRAKRLVENRRAALDQRTAENVERALAEVERVRAERAARKKK